MVARELLGKYLWRKTDKGTMVAKIVETEAYLAEGDPACHAHFRRTKRNEPMFAGGGISYVYFIYGCYYCFNVVTGEKDKGEAVLVRAVEPVQGQEIMQSYRPVKKIKELGNGPGKLCMALNITKSDNAIKLFERNRLFLTEGEDVEPDEIVTTTRIGINKAVDLPLRFYIKDNHFISRK